MTPSPRSPGHDVHIRPVAAGDVEALHAIFHHPEVARNNLRLPSMEPGETEAWFHERQPGHHRLVAVANGRVAGHLSLIQNQRPRLAHSARLGVMVHPDMWGRGVGSALVQAAIDLADQWLNIRRLEVGVQAHNAVARHLCEKMGFVLEGTRREAIFGDGAYQDEHVMARLHNPPQVRETAPSSPSKGRPEVTAVTVRPMTSSDAPALHAIAIHPAVARGTLQLPSMELGVVQQRTDEWKAGLYRYTAVAQHIDGSLRIVGSATLNQRNNPRLAHCAGLGISIHPDYWGIGAGTGLMETLVDLADNWLGLRRLELDVFTDNPTAVRLYKRMGFITEGTRRAQSFGAGRWADAHFMARLRP